MDNLLEEFIKNFEEQEKPSSYNHAFDNWFFIKDYKGSYFSLSTPMEDVQWESIQRTGIRMANIAFSWMAQISPKGAKNLILDMKEHWCQLEQVYRLTDFRLRELDQMIRLVYEEKLNSIDIDILVANRFSEQTVNELALYAKDVKWCACVEWLDTKKDLYKNVDNSKKSYERIMRETNEEISILSFQIRRLLQLKNYEFDKKMQPILRKFYYGNATPLEVTAHIAEVIEEPVYRKDPLYNLPISEAIWHVQRLLSEACFFSTGFAKKAELRVNTSSTREMIDETNRSIQEFAVKAAGAMEQLRKEMKQLKTEILEVQSKENERLNRKIDRMLSRVKEVENFVKEEKEKTNQETMWNAYFHNFKVQTEPPHG